MSRPHPTVQSVLFPKSRFSVAQASEWLRAHKFRAGKVHTTAQFHRFRQLPPDPSRQYLLVKLASGIRLVVFR